MMSWHRKRILKFLSMPLHRFCAASFRVPRAPKNFGYPLPMPDHQDRGYGAATHPAKKKLGCIVQQRSARQLHHRGADEAPAISCHTCAAVCPPAVYRIKLQRIRCITHKILCLSVLLHDFYLFPSLKPLKSLG